MEIHRADRAYRNRAVLLLAGVALLCAVLLWQLHAWLQHVSEGLGRSDPETVRYWLRWLLACLGVGLAVPAAALGASLRKLALASRVQGRFPPRDWKTWRDVRVLRDAAALRWARRIEVAAAVALCVALAFLAWGMLAWFRFG